MSEAALASVTTPALEPMAGWARHPWIESAPLASQDLEQLSRGAVLSRGLGRAYGDSALPPAGCGRTLALTPLADRILSFDEHSGILRAEAGLSLGTLRELLLERRWFTPVAPGTRHVTLGGMVASDVHGKNHHVAGCFGEHVTALRMRVGDGRVLEVTEQDQPELFRATIGGMGLTGHILEVAFRMKKIETPWIYQESERFPDLQSVLGALGEASASWPMTVAWIDTSARGAKTGRGIVMRGRWATRSEAPAQAPRIKPSFRVPFNFPSGLVNPFTINILNRLWYLKHGARIKAGVIHPESFFWLLDMVDEWNRVFGRRGFTQYQCVMPSDAQVYAEFLALFQRLRGCSFVTVFKDCGPAGKGILSFPQQGTSMALDIPIRGDETRKMVQELNAFVMAHGGRIYLTKDAFTTAEDFRTMYPRFEEWDEIRRRFDPERRLASAQSVRLMGDSLDSVCP